MQYSDHAYILIKLPYNLTSHMRKFINSVRRVLAQNSTLFPYLFVIRQLLGDKVQRLIDDKSGPGDPVSSKTLLYATTSEYTLGFLSSRLCLNPCNTKLMIWYFMVFLGILYWYVQMCIMIVYGQVAWASELSSLPMLIIDVIALLIFAVDIAVQLNAGYISRGAVILERRKVVSRYLHYYFYADIAIIVIELAALVSQNYYVNFAKLVVVWKFARLFEMDELVMRKLSLSTRLGALTSYVVLKQFLTIFMLSHTIGVGFYLVDLALVNSPVCQPQVNNSLCWLYSATAYSPIISYQWQIQYFYSVYWGVNTITNISYGDIAANNPFEVIYSLFCQCFGYVVFGYVTNKLVGAIIFANELRDQYRISLVEFDHYMDHLGLQISSQLDTVDFLKYRHWEENSRDLEMQEAMVQQLPRELKLELLENAYQKVCNGIQYFLGQGQAMRALLEHLKEKKLSNNDIVLSQGEPLNYLHYLQQGKLRILCNFNNREFHLAEINMPDQFLAAYEFFLNQRTQNKFISKGNTVLYFLPRQTFQDKARNDMAFKQNLRMLWYELKIKKNIAKVFYKCLKCGKGHHWHSCGQLFPDFKQVTLQNRSAKNKVQSGRSKRAAHRTWKDRARLKELAEIRRRNGDQILMRLQQRLGVLRRALRERSEAFQADCAYDWSSYLVQQNLKNLRNKWNQNKQARRLSSRPVFHK